MDENEFLSTYGLRSLSKFHEQNPYVFGLGMMLRSHKWSPSEILSGADNVRYRVGYEPAESQSGLFGGNSNWRGPVWFPVNYLFVQSLLQHHRHYGNTFTVL